MRTQYSSPLREQHGIALIVVLIMIVLVTLLGIAAVRTLTLQERMAANQFDRNLAMQSAERTLRLAEGIALTESLTKVQQNPHFQAPSGTGTGTLNGNYAGGTCDANGSDSSPCTPNLGLCSQPTSSCTPRWADPNFASWVTVTSKVPANPSSSALDADSNLSANLQQQYFIEFLGKGFPCTQDPGDKFDCSLYRITARTNQNTNRAVVILQSDFLARP